MTKRIPDELFQENLFSTHGLASFIFKRYMGDNSYFSCISKLSD